MFRDYLLLEFLMDEFLNNSSSINGPWLMPHAWEDTGSAEAAANRLFFENENKKENDNHDPWKDAHHKMKESRLTNSSSTL